MSLPDSFNDPFDCDLKLSFKTPVNDADENDLKCAILSLYRNHKPEDTYWFFDKEILQEIRSWADGSDQIIGEPAFVEKIKARIRTFGLQCFSETFDNPLMWGYYTSGHKGFGIEYECGHNTVAMKGGGKFSLDPIVYVSELPEYSVSEVILSPHEFQRRLYSTKSYHWMHEKEHRLIYFDLNLVTGKKGKAIAMPEGIRATGIYAGLHSKQIDQLKEAAQTLGVPLFKMYKERHSYTMKFSEIEF